MRTEEANALARASSELLDELKRRNAELAVLAHVLSNASATLA